MTYKQKNWTKLEDDLVTAGVMKYGDKHWSKISTLLTNKNPSDCKNRWKVINPLTTSFTKDDIVILLGLVGKFPNQWSFISKSFKNKTSKQCHDMYQFIIEKEIGTKVKTTAQNIRAGEKSPAIFNKAKGKFVESRPLGILNGTKFISDKEIRERNYGEDEIEMINMVRARLENTKKRKDLK